MDFEFRFGAPTTAIATENGTLALKLMNRQVAGAGCEVWPLAAGGELAHAGDLVFWNSAEQRVGAAVVPVDDRSLREQTESVYRQIGEVCAGLNLHRYWNFIPRINAPVGELDRYMCFSTGRSDAFAHRLSHGKDERAPPASAVGTCGDHLAVVFLAGTAALHTLENPAQVPAYRYPRRYGPAPPAFARAGSVATQNRLYISGTASILASESRHAGDVRAQAQLVCENLRRLVEVAGYPDACDLREGYRRCIRIYLREPDLWHDIAPIFAAQLTTDADQVSVVEADICRPELLVEVEMTVMVVN